MSPVKSTLDETAWVKRFSAKTDRKERAKGERLRAEFVARAQLRPPNVLRLIDIQATCQATQVILRSYKEVLQLHDADDPGSGNNDLAGIDYSAISHTYGMEVYSIFDCECASTLSPTAKVPPRCWDKPCPHFNGENDELHKIRNRIVNHILEMCHIISKAGVRYAWHDGVCIARYDELELTATIKSIGWIYAAAKETIVFLHYIGMPMAPIAPRGYAGYELACRWHTRVWTFQEAALSRSRRYCVRVCKRSLHFNRLSGDCDILEEFEKKAKKFEQKVSRWYNKNTSEIDVITEERFLESIYEALEPLQQLWNGIRTFKTMLEEVRMQNGVISQQLEACVDSWYPCIQIWFECLEDVSNTLTRTCLRFPELGDALVQCSRRDSKHLGDRINSVLTLAGLKDLVAPKDFKKAGDSMEAWTLKFFEQQGERGLAWAVLSGNEGLAHREDLDQITHSWVPLLWRPLSGPKVGGYECDESWGIRFRVCKDNMKLELIGELLCVGVTFKLKLKEQGDDDYIQDQYEKAHGKGGQLAIDHDGTQLIDAILVEGERNNQSECEVDGDTYARLANKSLSVRVECLNRFQHLWGFCKHSFKLLFKYICKYLYSHSVTRLWGTCGCDVREHPGVYQICTNDEVDTDADSDEDSGDGDSHNHDFGDEISIDTDWDDEAGEENGDDKEEDDQAYYAEGLFDEAGMLEQNVDDEMINDKSSDGAYCHAGTIRGADINAEDSDNEKQRMTMDIVSIYTDGSHSFAVRLPEAEATNIMGMATFYPLQAFKDGRTIAGQHIKEGEILDAYLVAPLHYDWIISSVQPGFLIIQELICDHNNNITASKIGMLTTPKSKAELLRSSHLASKTINKLIIN